MYQVMLVVVILICENIENFSIVIKLAKSKKLNLAKSNKSNLIKNKKVDYAKANFSKFFFTLGAKKAFIHLQKVFINVQIYIILN